MIKELYNTQISVCHLVKVMAACWIWLDVSNILITEACIGVLVIQDICHFTSRDIGYCPFYFQGYGILCSIFWLLSGMLNI